MYVKEVKVHVHGMLQFFVLHRTCPMYVIGMAAPSFGCTQIEHLPVTLQYLTPIPLSREAFYCTENKTGYGQVQGACKRRMASAR